MKRTLFISFLGLSVAFFAIQLTKREHRKNLSKNNSTLRLAAISLGDGGSDNEAAERANIISSASDKVELEDFQALIYGTDRMDRMASEAVVQKLRSIDEKEMSALFVTELHEIASGSPDARAHLVYMANLVQSDELWPFWEDLALRKTPRSESESEVLGLTELTLDAKVIHGEMSTAIRNLGLIAYRRQEARGVLETIVLHPQPLSHPQFVREYAFYALKEADERSVQRILRGLPGNDPLRLSLLSHLAGR